MALIDLPPDPPLLDSIRSRKPSLNAFLAEAFDNSFDAGADNIRAHIDADHIVIKEDGHGIDHETTKSLARLGSHVPSPTTALGAWGIGVKYSAIPLADKMKII